MKRIALLTLFLAFTATSGNIAIARLLEKTEAVDVDVPFARLGLEDGTRFAKIGEEDGTRFAKLGQGDGALFAKLGQEDGTRFAKLGHEDRTRFVKLGQGDRTHFAKLGHEDGTRFAKLEPTDEDPLPLLVELEPVGNEADDDADLDSYEEDVDESHPTPNVLVDVDNGEVGDGEKTGRASGRIQRRKGGRREKLIKKTQKKIAEMEHTDEMHLFSKLRPSEDEDEDMLELEEHDVSDEEESTDNEETEVLVQSGGRHRIRQRLRKGGNRGANKRSRRRSFMKLKTEKNNKARRFKKIRKNNEDKIKKVQNADEVYEGRRHGRRNGATKHNGGRHIKRGRRLGGAAGGCKKSSMICCDGSSHMWRRSPKGWHKKMTCENGDKPVCFVDQCHYTVLDYFVSLI